VLFGAVFLSAGVFSFFMCCLPEIRHQKQGAPYEEKGMPFPRHGPRRHRSGLCSGKESFKVIAFDKDKVKKDSRLGKETRNYRQILHLSNKHIAYDKVFALSSLRQMISFALK
jgi:hypothetical protein